MFQVPAGSAKQTWIATLIVFVRGTLLIGAFMMGFAIDAHAAQEVSPPSEDALQFFESRIRPILIKHCYECHSVETEKSGGLLLDSKEGWLNGGETGVAIVAGKPEEGSLVRAISYLDPRLKMPPDGKLPPQAVEDLKMWIAAGAVDPRKGTSPIPTKSTALTLEQAQQHWAYRPVKRSGPLAAEAGKVSNSVIDAYIDSQLASSGILPATEANRLTLLRRLKFDLHGLPPSTEEIAEFEADDAPDAYERWVDRLLASPRFGERLARRWLDVARYAESYTLRGFVMPEAWRYRDYCISAFSQDLPFDQFVREQIAGDLMVSDDLNVRRRQQTAVTFLLMGNSNLEEQDKEQLDMDVVDEQLETLGRAFMGQTIGCARCHDHKFDPIPTRDYYALAGILKASTVLKHENVSKWVEVPLAMDPATDQHFRAIEKERSSLLSQMKVVEKQMKGKEIVAGDVVAASSLQGIIVDDVDAKKVGQWTSSSSVRSYVGESYLHDSATGRGTKTVTFEPKSIPPGNYEVRVSHSAGENRATNAMFRVFSADGDSLHRVNQRSVAPIDRLWTSLGRFRFEKDGQAYVLLSNEEADGHVIADAVQFLPVDATAIEALRIAVQEEKRDTEVSGDVRLSLEKKLKEMKATAKKLENELEQRPMAMGLQAVDQPKDIPIHIRGSVHALGEVVPRGFLQVASSFNDSAVGANFKNAPLKIKQDSPGPGRLELANWLADGRHPLTSRVAVNRIWYWTMGEGLVDTVDNFGTTGNQPSHPELLDALALRLIDSDWSVKQIVREIVCSSAYRRSSDGRLATGTAKDPENRLYAVANLKRLDAESIRDSILQISGQLILDVGGKRIASGTQMDYGYVHVAPCRSIYIPTLRNSMPDLLTTFDMADTSVGIGRRSRTTVAQQALVMLNHPVVIEQSRFAAARWARSSLSQEDILEGIAFEIWGRRLKSSEKEKLLAFLVREGAQRQNGAQIDEKRLSTVIQSMIGSLDFRYLD